MFDWLNLHTLALTPVAAAFGGTGFFAFVFTPLVFRFMAHENAAHSLRQVFPVYHRLIASLTILPALLLLPGGSFTVEIVILLAVAAAAIAATGIWVVSCQ